MQNNVVAFSLADILWICSAIITLSAAISIIAKMIERFKAPNSLQDERLNAIEKKIELFEGYFLRDKQRLDNIERGSRITQKSLLALMSHAINGNDINKLVEARDELENYLIDPGRDDK